MKRQKLDPLTYTDHVALGKELKRMRAGAVEMVIRVCRATGTRSNLTQTTDKLVAAIEKLRSELDNELCKSLPATDNSWRGVYYGDN